MAATLRLRRRWDMGSPPRFCPELASNCGRSKGGDFYALGRIRWEPFLLDEMYRPAVARALAANGIEAFTVIEMGLAGWAYPDVLAAAAVGGCALLTENVADFARLTAGGHHAGVRVAFASRFSRRPSGIRAIAAALHALADQLLQDRLVYL